MGRKRTPGLFKRGGIWRIDKRVHGRRLAESTGTGDLAQAEACLSRRIEEVRQAIIYGTRPRRIFRQAATKYLREHQHKASIGDDAAHLKQLDPHIGHLPLEKVHMGTLQAFIDARFAAGIKTKSINLALGVVRRTLNLAASQWLDEHGLTWLAAAPKIKLLTVSDARAPYPLSWDEQAVLFRELPPHLARMALFKVNTGCREQEVCGLRWEWEVAVPGIGSVFVIPATEVKNREDRLVVLNDIARSVVESVRGEHPDYVFTFRGHRVGKINNTAWKNARRRAGIPVRVHDLKHTFGRRLRAAGVSYEDRQDLLGHRSGRITTHYSMAELDGLLESANRICAPSLRKSPTLFVLKRAVSV